MAIIQNQWNSIYVGGRKGRKFEIRFCPDCVKAPWSIHSRRTNGYYFTTLRETLAFAAGRGYIEQHLISEYQSVVAAALDQKFDELETEPTDGG